MVVSESQLTLRFPLAVAVAALGAVVEKEVWESELLSIAQIQPAL